MMKVLKWKLQSVLWDLVVQSFLLCIDLCFYYMTSDNVFSDWLTSLVMFFDKTLYSPRKKSRQVKIIFQIFSRHL